MPENKAQSHVATQDRVLLVTPVWQDSSRLAGFGPGLATALAGSDHAIDWVIADDGSGAEEREKLNRLLDEFQSVYPHVSVHFADQHRGKGSVVREAWSLHPEVKWLAFVDADGSLSPEEFLRMVAEAKRVGQTVLGIRKRTETTEVSLSPMRFLAHRMYILCVRVLVGVRCEDPQCGAKLLLGSDYRPIADALKEEGLAFDAELLAAMANHGAEWTQLPVTWIEKDGGKVRPLRDAWGMLAALWRIRGRLGK